MPAAVRLIAAAAAAYVALVVFVAVFQRRLLYFPSRGYPVTPAALNLPFEELDLTASDGVVLRAWLIPGFRSGAPVILYFHGNAATLSALVELAAAFRSAGFSFFAVDYRGYGESGGVPTEAGLYRDAEAAWSLLMARGIPPGRVIVYGQSLGAAVAARLAARVHCGGLVLEGGFPSLWASARLHYPWVWIPPFALLDRYPTAENAGKASCPVLVIQAELDRIAPPEFGRRIHDSIGARSRFLIVRHADHNSITPDIPEVRDALECFRKDSIGG